MDDNRTYEDGNLDESMMSLSEMVSDMVQPFESEISQEAGFSMSLVGIRLDMPVQLQVTTDENGQVLLGITPPIYKIETSFNPVFHQVRFSCETIE